MACINPQVTHVEYVEITQRKLREFKAYWMKGHEREPGEFPLRLTYAEWDEQFELFASGNIE